MEKSSPQTQRLRVQLLCHRRTTTTSQTKPDNPDQSRKTTRTLHHARRADWKGFPTVALEDKCAERPRPRKDAGKHGRSSRRASRIVPLQWRKSRQKTSSGAQPRDGAATERNTHARTPSLCASGRKPCPCTETTPTTGRENRNTRKARIQIALLR